MTKAAIRRAGVSMAHWGPVAEGPLLCDADILLRNVDGSIKTMLKVFRDQQKGVWSRSTALQGRNVAATEQSTPTQFHLMI